MTNAALGNVTTQTGTPYRIGELGIERKSHALQRLDRQLHRWPFVAVLVLQGEKDFQLIRRELR